MSRRSSLPAGSAAVVSPLTRATATAPGSFPRLSTRSATAGKASRGGPPGCERGRPSRWPGRTSRQRYYSRTCREKLGLVLLPGVSAQPLPLHRTLSRSPAPAWAGARPPRLRPRVSASRDIRTPDARAGVAVVTDSTPYLPRGLVDRWGIREVSLYVGWDGDLRPEH